MYIKWHHIIVDRDSVFPVQTCFKNIYVYNMHIKWLHIIVDRDSDRCQFLVQTCFKKYIWIQYAHKVASHNSR